MFYSNSITPGLSPDMSLLIAQMGLNTHLLVDAGSVINFVPVMGDRSGAIAADARISINATNPTNPTNRTNHSLPLPWKKKEGVLRSEFAYTIHAKCNPQPYFKEGAGGGPTATNEYECYYESSVRYESARRESLDVFAPTLEICYESYDSHETILAIENFGGI